MDGIDDRSTAKPPRGRAPSRQGLRSMTVPLEPEIHRALRVLAAKQDRTLEDLAREAFTALLKRYRAR